LNGMRVQLPALCPDDQIVSSAHDGLYFGNGRLPLVEWVIRNSPVSAERSTFLQEVSVDRTSRNMPAAHRSGSMLRLPDMLAAIQTVTTLYAHTVNRVSFHG
jgi:hypothetical protein